MFGLRRAAFRRVTVLARKRNRGGISAWLVTWEHADAHAKPPGRVAAVYNTRGSPERVKELVELLYVGASFAIFEQIAYANNRSFNPYPARFGSLRGILCWMGEIYCGHDPWLFARLVDNLRTEESGDGVERVLWDERPKPTVPHLGGG